MTQRDFRTEESYAAEAVARDLLPGFLNSVGFREIVDERKEYGNAQSQTIRAVDTSGERVAMRVRLCWRYRDGKGRNYSAAQLMARIRDDDWKGSIQTKVDRQRAEGVTHLLLVQPDGEHVETAALLPLDAVWPIWRAQRDISSKLANAGLLGARRKNHAMNGRSPTIYIRDERSDRAVDVTDALWNYPGVVKLTESGQSGNDPDSPPDSAFGDSETNRLVERAAVEFVREHYENSGWTVRSVEHEGCGFDLDCSLGKDSLHVEVKGVAGAVKQFNLTAGEFRRAQSDRFFRLALVTTALASAELHEYSGPALLLQFEATPMQYRLTLTPQH